MQYINVNELKEHPRNNEFFDDITGENWDAFLESIKQRGVIEPVIITKDKVIVSGHQRVRACKELGIEEVMCDVHCYEDDDSILQDLLETNIRQRGIGNTNQRKMGLCMKELGRIYGLRNGSFGKVAKNNLESNNFTPKNEDELLKSLGLNVSRQTIQNYKKLTEMIPELEDLVDTGIVTNTTALAIMRELSEDEQVELISQMDTTKKITKSEVEKYIKAYNDLKANPPLPSDYEFTKRQLADYEKENEQLSRDFQRKTKELQETREQMEKMKVDDPVEQYNKKLKDSVLLFCSKVNTFIEQVGGYVWLTEEINKIPNLEREGYIRAVHAIKTWADQMEYNLNNNIKEIY